MTKMYKYLYKKMYDDLKDAEMLIDYACHMKEEGLEDVAKYFAENAVYRLSKSFKEAHALFTTHATQEKGFTEEELTRFREYLDRLTQNIVDLVDENTK